MKTVVICGPHNSSGVEHVAELVREYGGNPIMVPLISGFEAVPGAEIHIIFRKQNMDLSSYEAGSAQVGVIYANNQACDSLGGSDLEKIPGANLLYLSPAENVSGWIRRTLGGDNLEDDFSWNFSTESGNEPNLPVMIKPKHRLKIACYSPLGGIGKTTTSVIIGKLAQESGHSVCIVESDNDNAGVLQALGTSSVTEGLGSILAEEWEQSDLFAAKTKKYLQVVEGIAVLPMGADTLEINCTQDNIKNLYEWVDQQGYDVVIYDLPPQLADISVYHALQEVDIVILLGEPTIKAEENLIRFVAKAQNLQGLKDIAAKLKLIVNKYVPTSGVKDIEISEATGISLIATIPANPEAYYKMINNRKLDIPSDSPWRDAWNALNPVPGGVQQTPKKAKKKSFWKGILGIK